MNDYDDSDEYSSANSFRARSNTWPLNRPDLAVPSSGVCIDETLPEIELEDDDLFTTNENWSTGLVTDHDIMSWDPILNAQNQPQQAATIIHHHHQPNRQQQPQSHHQPTHLHHHHHQQQQQQPQPERQHPIHLHHHQQQQQQQQQQQPQQSSSVPKPPHHHQQPPPPQQQHQITPHQHEPVLAGPLVGVEQAPGVQVAQQAPHIRQQPPPPPPPQPQIQQQQQPPPQQHQTLNSSHCLDTEDPSDYHIQQLHHLRLDSNSHAPGADPQQGHYVSSLSTMCIQGSTANIGNDSYNISPDHQQHTNHHHLQPLTSARYDLDQHDNYELKAHDDELQHNHHHLTHQHHHHHHHNHLPHQHHHQQQPQHHQQQQHHLSQQQQQQSHHHHQLHQMTSASLDNHSSHMLSSSLSTSGIGLSGDLEDLDYKTAVDPSAVLQNPHYDEQQLQDQQPELPTLGSGEALNVEPTKQSNSNSASKTKLNTPRRNAWGNMSYADLISQAINSTSDKRLTLSQIYDWMVQHVPYFKDKGDSNSSAGWKNSVRHNLSLHSRFKRLQNEGTGKSSWWTINPEANVGKCARRRAASMEASKYEKKRGRAKKKAEAIRQGLVSYPSLTNSSLNGSSTTLEQQQSQAQSLNQFQAQQPEQQQPLDQFSNQQQPQQQQQQQPPQPQPQHQIQTLDHYGSDHPSQQQQRHLQQLQRLDGQNNIDQISNLHEQSLYVAASQSSPYEEKTDKMQQPHQHQQSQYYYQFELSTAL